MENHIYSKKLRKFACSKNINEQQEIKDSIYKFYNFNEEEALKIQYNIPLIFKTKEGYINLDISDKEVIGKDINYFLSNIKKVISLDISIEDIKLILYNFKITENMYQNIISILFRIFVNIPFILFGEKGCQKTELIKKLMKLINKNEQNLIIKNLHPRSKEKEINEIIEIAEKNLEKSKNDIICVFFNEMNNVKFLLSKMKEIFVNHSFNGKMINERIRFIGAFNYIGKNSISKFDEGLQFEMTYNTNVEISYYDCELPYSMLNYIFFIKNLENNGIKNEKKTDEESLEDINDKNYNSILSKTLNNAIDYSIKFIINYTGKSIFLGGLPIFQKAFKFFIKYYENKNNEIKNEGYNNSDKDKIQSKIQSFILSLYVTYFIKIKNLNKEITDSYLKKINSFLQELTNKFQIKEWINVKNFMN